MRPHQIFAIVLALAALNGIFSPYVVIVFAFAPLWWPAFVPLDVQVVIYFASLILSTATILIAGVPAALVEGAMPRTRGTATAMWIWVAGALALSWPALIRFLGMFLAG